MHQRDMSSNHGRCLILEIVKEVEKRDVSMRRGEEEIDYLDQRKNGDRDGWIWSLQEVNEVKNMISFSRGDRVRHGMKAFIHI